MVYIQVHRLPLAAETGVFNGLPEEELCCVLSFYCLLYGDLRAALFIIIFVLIDDCKNALS